MTEYKYLIKFKDYPISNQLSLAEAMKSIERYRQFFLNLHIERVEDDNS
jgi:hypothetical protein